MLCAKCGQSLTPPPMEGGPGARVVILTSSDPFPLRCVGCAKVVCNVCQTIATDAPEEGTTTAHVSTDCTFCGDRLEVHGREVAPSQAEPEEEEAPPVSKERRRELKRAYRDDQLAAAQAQGVPPGLQRLFDTASPLPSSPPAPDNSTVLGGCAGVAVFFVGALIGWSPRGGEGSYLGMFVGAVVGAVLGCVVAWVIDMILLGLRKLFG